MQREVAVQLGVHIESVKNWERGLISPAIRQMPKIIAFLGYDPEPEPAGIPQRILSFRRRLGLTQEGLAKTLAVDPVTVYRWEKGVSVPPVKTLQRIQDLRKSLDATPQ